MSGPNQHHLPQMLQRGFLASGSQERTWLFKAGVTPILEQIADIGAGEHFYSKPASEGGTDLDDRITAYERAQLRKLLRKLRTLPLKSAPSAKEAAEIVAHLTMRSGHFRSVLTDGVKSLGEGAVDLFARPGFLAGHFGFDSTKPTERFDSVLEKIWEENPGFAESGIPLAALTRMAFTLGRENFSEISPEFVNGIRAYGDLMVEQFGPGVSDSHNKALAQDFRGGVRRSELETFDWAFIAAPKPGALLPDCGAIAIVEGGEPVPFMMADRDKLIAVVAPLSSTRLLVGIKQGAPAAELADVNRHLASCSHEFFIAASNAPEFEALGVEIGKRSSVVLDEALHGALKHYEAALPTSSELPKPSQGVGGSNQTKEEGAADFAYQLSFTGCGDEASIQPIASAVQYVVQSISSFLPLRRLDGITFAADYPAALSGLDRGMEGWKAPTTVSPEIGLGLAQSPLVMRDGVLKARVIIQAWVGNGLTSEDEEHVQFAVHVLAHQLAVVAMVEYTDTALPDALVQRIQGPMNRLLYGVASSAPDNYCAARLSAPYAPQSMQATYRDMAADTLQKLHQTLPVARLAYRQHGDMDRLLDEVLPIVRLLLSQTSLVIGHCDGLEEPVVPSDSELAKLLDQTGLSKWLPTFHADLQAFWDRLGQWASFDEFYAFTKHAERILWQYAMIPWERDAEVVHISVPLGIDAVALLAISEHPPN